ncbi:MAG: hypothetical protein U0794_01855 [Isosphaeraceae bacterium]
MDQETTRPELRIAPHQVSGLLAELGAQGYTTYAIGPAKDGEEFFQSVSRNLPLKPRLREAYAWDELIPSLWNGIEALNVSKVAILWILPDQMRDWSPEEYVLADEALATVAQQFDEATEDGERPVELKIYMIY